MLIYSNNRKSKYYEVPIWKADRFMRLRGFVDSLTHKTDFRTNGEKNTLSGGFYEHVHRELQTLEAAQVAWLNKSLGPQIAEFKAIPRASDYGDSTPRSTTGARRAAREAGARRAAAQGKRRELIASIRSELLTAEGEINTAYCTANDAITRYGKASKFKVLDEEIPHFTAVFSAADFARRLGIEEGVS